MQLLLDYPKILGDYFKLSYFADGGIYPAGSQTLWLYVLPMVLSCLTRCNQSGTGLKTKE